MKRKKGRPKTDNPKIITKRLTAFEYKFIEHLRTGKLDPIIYSIKTEMTKEPNL